MEGQKSGVRTSRSGSASLLAVPSERYGSAHRRSSSGIKFNEILFEEESEVIKSCFEISAALGLMKSFSTSDICSLNDISDQSAALRQSSSEVVLLGSVSRVELPNLRRLDYTSRSCSTWVNLGDPVLSTSQLPSPQAQSGKQMDSPTITSIDFIKSINKKVRQMYLRRRLKAIGRLYNSCQINANQTKPMASNEPSLDTTKASNKSAPNVVLKDCPHLSHSSLKQVCTPFDLADLCFRSAKRTLSLTAKDIDRDKGKPLSKYERNIMIFNWLQNVDEEELSEQHID